jgi:predicted acylesterase/phospholipase RssA
LPEALASLAKPLGEPNFRSWGDEVSPHIQEWLAADAELDAQKYPALVGKPHHYLAISGGGANGAFGVGLLIGWGARGDRPDFTVVSGVSTGALAAPFVFLGRDYDELLRNLFTSMSTGDILKKANYFNRFFGDSVMDSEPLAALLERYIDEPMMAAIAAESEKGRRLYIGTTHLDAARPVVWNISNIATSGHPGALDLIRRVLRASASVPALFPPVLIEVEADGRNYDELHVDGGVTAQISFYPVEMDWTRVLEKFRVPGAPQMYIIRNSRLNPRWRQTRNKVLPIAGRSIAALIRTQGIGDLYRIFHLASRDGLDFNLAYIPNDFNTPQKEIFDPEYMQDLFDLGYRMGKDGYPWSKIPPGREEMINENPQTGIQE